MFRRPRFAKVIDAQLDLFVRDYPDVIDEASDRLEAYNRAGRVEASSNAAACRTSSAIS